jgi:septal ring factor EnvC (AmiA/AmiB activator)
LQGIRSQVTDERERLSAHAIEELKPRGKSKDPLNTLSKKQIALQSHILEQRVQIEKLMAGQAQLQDEVARLRKERQELMQSSSSRGPQLFHFSDDEAQSSNTKEVKATYNDHDVNRMMKLRGFPPLPSL